MAPASSDSGGNLGKMAGQLGGLASLAGINLGGGESNDVVIAMEIMKTWGFQEEFIKKHNLEVAVFAARGWNQSTNELILDDELYDVEQSKWLRDAPAGKTVEPTSWELFEAFKRGLTISQNKDSGLITVGYTHFSPIYAQKITQWMIEDVNFLLKERALDDAAKNISYLEKQINRTSLSDMQGVFYTLIEEQTKTKMLADVSDEYVFRSVSLARVPEMKSGPGRAMICLIITFLGGFLSVIFVLFLGFFKKKAR